MSDGRQDNILQAMQLLAHGRYTLRELAAALNVSQKTVTRYLATLRHAGFDVRQSIEPHGRKRWRIARRTIPPIVDPERAK